MMKHSIVATGLLAAVGLASIAPAQTITLGTGSDPNFATIFHADAAGIFARHGLDVDVQVMAQSADAADAVVAGVNQLAGGSESTMLTRAATGGLKVIGIFSQSSSTIKMVVRNGVDGLADIRKIGYVPGSASELTAYKALQQAGIDPASVQWMPAAPPEIPALLARGDVDGYFLWEPWPSRGVELGGRSLMTSGEAGYTAVMTVAAAPSWLAENGPKAAALMAALKDSCDEIGADPAKAAAVTAKTIRIDQAQAAKLLEDITCDVRSITPEDRAAFAEVADFLLSRKVLKGPVDLDALIVTPGAE